MRRRSLILALAPLFAGALEAQHPRVAEVQIAPRYLRLRVDAVAPIVATAYDPDGIPVDVAFEWSSSNINVADVGPDGRVRGIAPGAAVVTAATGAGAARRAGQISVFVLRPGRAMVVSPVPPAPGTPQTEPPGGWVQPPPMNMDRAHMDSMIRASIDCAEPFVNAINPARACWDERARLREPSRLVLPVSVRSVCPSIGRSMIGVLVHVLESGAVDTVRVYAPTGCTAVDEVAEAAARALIFDPARRDGQPYRAWVRLQLRAGP
jgi:hypothetical protein